MRNCDLWHFILLGSEQLWTGKRFFVWINEGCDVFWSILSSVHDALLYAQIGIGTVTEFTTPQPTPLAVSGLSSDVVMVALGQVRARCVATSCCCDECSHMCC
jgi:hypothetical protein